ncbi:hypothetical protein RCL1_007755 [Eukaryota sp. TZLM3-RCL]
MQQVFIPVEQYRYLVASASVGSDDLTSTPFIRIFDARSNDVIMELEAESHFASFSVSAPCDDDCFIGGSMQNGNIAVFRLSDLLKEIEKPYFYTSEIQTESLVALTPFSGGRLIASVNSTLYVYDLETASPTSIAQIPIPGECHALSFNQNSKVNRIAAIACLDTSSLRSVVAIFDLSKNQIIMKLDLGSTTPTTLVWSPEVATLLAVSVVSEGLPSVQLWSMRVRTSPVATISLDSVVTSLAWFTQDHRFMLAGDKAGHVHLLSVTQQSIEVVGLAEKIESNTESTSVTSISVSPCISGAAVVSSQSGNLLTSCVYVPTENYKPIPSWILSIPTAPLVNLVGDTSLIVVDSKPEIRKHWLPVSSALLADVEAISRAFAAQDIEYLLSKIEDHPTLFTNFIQLKLKYSNETILNLLKSLLGYGDLVLEEPKQEEMPAIATSPFENMIVDDDVDFFENLIEVASDTSSLQESPETSEDLISSPNDFIKELCLGTVSSAYELLLPHDPLSAAVLFMFLQGISPDQRLLEHLNQSTENQYVSALITQNFENLIDSATPDTWQFVAFLILQHSPQNSNLLLKLLGQKLSQQDQINNEVLEVLFTISSSFNELKSFWKSKSLDSELYFLTRTSLLALAYPEACEKPPVQAAQVPKAPHRVPLSPTHPPVSHQVVSSFEQQIGFTENVRPLVQPPMVPTPVSVTPGMPPHTSFAPPSHRPVTDIRPPSIPTGMTPGIPTTTPTPVDEMINYEKPSEIISAVDVSSALPNFSNSVALLKELVSSISLKQVPRSQVSRIDSAVEKTVKLLKSINERNLTMDVAPLLEEVLENIKSGQYRPAQQKLRKLPAEVNSNLALLISTLKTL